MSVLRIGWEGSHSCVIQCIAIANPARFMEQETQSQKDEKSFPSSHNLLVVDLRQGPRFLTGIQYISILIGIVSMDISKPEFKYRVIIYQLCDLGLSFNTSVLPFPPL